MPEVDVVDSTWIDVDPGVLAPVFAEAANWSRWWPELTLQVADARGRKGMRWLVESGCDGAVTGSMEVWLEPAHDGTVVHYFLRLNGTGRPLRPQERARLAHQYRLRTKQAFWAVADKLDPGRVARVAAPPRVSRNL